MDKDAFSRVNFLFQIANYAKNINPFLSRHYVKEMSLICEKRVLRKYLKKIIRILFLLRAKDVKQTFCKCCKKLYNVSDQKIKSIFLLFKLKIKTIKIEIKKNKIYLLQKCSLCCKTKKIFIDK